MPVQRFRTKPVEVDAMRFTGDNLEELVSWSQGGFAFVEPEDRDSDPDIIAEVWDFLHATWVGVKAGQWIVRGAKGEFYPCDDETFHWKYEEVETLAEKFHKGFKDELNDMGVL